MVLRLLTHFHSFTTMSELEFPQTFPLIPESYKDSEDFEDFEEFEELKEAEKPDHSSPKVTDFYRTTFDAPSFSKEAVTHFLEQWSYNPNGRYDMILDLLLPALHKIGILVRDFETCFSASYLDEMI